MSLARRLKTTGGYWQTAGVSSRDCRLEIATTALRPDLVLCSPSQKKLDIVELTTPWEDSVDEAYERKRLRYAEHWKSARWRLGAEGSWRGLPLNC